MNYLVRAVSCMFLVVSLFSAPAFADADLSVVNINTADATTLATVLSGVGESKAKAIIIYRQTHGEFKAAEELTEVKGIGLKLVKQNQDRIQL